MRAVLRLLLGIAEELWLTDEERALIERFQHTGTEG